MRESWSGYKRARTTPRSVRRAERISRFFITLGGFGTILAVVTIFGYLLSVIAPLFAGGRLEAPTPPLAFHDAGPTPGGDDIAPPPAAPIVRAGMDELGLLLWTLGEDGTLIVRRMADGSTVARRRLFEDRQPTAWAFAPRGTVFAAGFADGTLQTGEIQTRSRYVDLAEAPEVVRRLPPGGTAPSEDGALQVTPTEQVRYQVIDAEVQPPQKAAEGAVRALDVGGTMASGLVLALVDDAGHLRAVRESLRQDMRTGGVTRRLRTTEIPHDAQAPSPRAVLLDGAGGSLLTVAEDGSAVRYDVRAGTEPRAVERFDLVPGTGRVTATTWLNGKTTLVVGDDQGGVRAWFGTKPEDAPTADGVVFRMAHELPRGPSAVRAFHGSARERSLAIAYAGGVLRVVQVTAATILGEAQTGALDTQAIALSPKDDLLVAVGVDRFQVLTLRTGHAEVTLATLFTPVWYEGAEAPAHVWQSTGGTDDFEPKLGLWPLVFGTLKATLYCILMAAPIALLAAVYTSEFLTSRARAPIKSVVEMMAGLPSVVLGFLGALIIAPFVQGYVPAVLAAFVMVPFALVLGSRLWQFLPGDVAIRMEGSPRLLAQGLALLAGILLATVVGPVVERVGFGGDLVGWLDGGAGSPIAGFALLLLPVCVLAVALFNTRVLGPLVQARSAAFSRRACAVLDLARLGVSTSLVLGLAVALGAGLALLGLDPRGGVLGPYSQKNSLIVGFLMGFAVIPIIYTLAEDALSSVPRTLKEGSLGSGATPWQTAWRITIPTAMSGLFSALMVGLGRAVGETMIVLMATGNTPILDWNLGSGFRTLAANIAVELPEAPRDTTHFRTLFLAAFLLFLMTFAINTVAELVRRTFRKRAAQL